MKIVFVGCLPTHCVFDSKSKDTQAVLEEAPLLHDYLDDESRLHFEELKQLLDAAGIKYSINQRLVRGLDYYSKTVFEWVTDQLGAQGTVCAGGRYDGLVEQLGGKAAPAIGFAMGIERLCLLLEETGSLPAELNANPDVYIVIAGDKAKLAAVKLAEQLRGDLPQVKIVSHCGGGSFKSQFKKADKSGAQIAIVIGDDEAEKRVANIKWLRSDEPKEQVTIAVEQIGQLLTQELN